MAPTVHTHASQMTPPPHRMKAVNVYNFSEMELALSSGHEKEKTK